jgi:group II intron reverse transcriptase/maturase
MHQAYRNINKKASAGIDGVEYEEFEEKLEDNLVEIVNKLKSGKYRAPAVKRTNIPKGDGKTRPIGIPTLADKVMQRAVTMVLDVDIKGYFDNIDHGHLRSFLDLRVNDGVIRRAIDKWLKAGVMEEGVLSYPGIGTPQGGVISPLLANIYLHEILDKWFEWEVKPRLRDKAFMVRYADDFVIVCKDPRDAQRVFEVLPKRLGRFGLELHPIKSKMIDFRRPPKGGCEGSTFDLLGFTHYWGKSRKGYTVVKKKTAKDRFSRALKRVAEWCRINRHRKVREQWKTLCLKLNGHYNYYGVTGNYKALSRFFYEVNKIWRKWLNRRSQKGRMNWDKFNRLLGRYKLSPPVCKASIYRRKTANP